MNFACELMDLCRGTQEVEAVLSEGSDSNCDNGKRDPLARLKMAIRYQEKKVHFLHCWVLYTFLNTPVNAYIKLSKP